MRDLLTQQHKQLLWKDECGDNFIILKYAEIYQSSDTKLRLLIFNKDKAILLKKKGLINDFDYVGDALYMADAKVEFLKDLIALGSYRKRPHINGNRISNLEDRLGHNILPYRPELDTEEEIIK